MPREVDNDMDLVAVSQVDIVLVSLVKSQEGEPNVEESVAMEGSESIDDLVKIFSFQHLLIHHTCSLPGGY